MPLRITTSLLALALMASACADSTAGPSTTTTSVPAASSTSTTTSVSPGTTASPQPPGLGEDGTITDARTVSRFIADTVLAWGEAALDPAALAEGIRGVYPVGVGGYLVEADPTGISLAVTTVDAKDVASADNPHVVAFAVADADGRCIGRAVTGYPAPDMDIEVAVEGPCLAGSVIETVRQAG